MSPGSRHVAQTEAEGDLGTPEVRGSVGRPEASGGVKPPEREGRAEKNGTSSAFVGA